MSHAFLPAVVLPLLFSADDAIIEGHLARLEEEKGYLLEILDEPEGSLKHKALVRYASSPKGAARLGRLFLEEISALAIPVVRMLPGGKYEKAVLLIEYTRSTGEPDFTYAFAEIPARTSTGSGGSGILRGRTRVGPLSKLLAHADLLPLPDMTLAGQEDLSFRVLPADAAFMVSGLKPASGDLTGRRLPVVVARRISSGKEGREWLGSEALPALIEGLESPKEPLRSLARQTARRIGMNPAEPVDLVLARTRREFNMPLDAIGMSLRPHAASSLPVLLEALDDPDAKFRRDAIFFIRGLGPTAAGAIPALVKKTEDDDSAVRGSAVFALGSMGKAAVPALADLLKNPNSDVKSLPPLGLS